MRHNHLILIKSSIFKNKKGFEVIVFLSKKSTDVLLLLMLYLIGPNKYFKTKYFSLFTFSTRQYTRNIP